MNNIENYIHKESLVVGAAYKVAARNFQFALWDGKKFAGVRNKFGQNFIDYEYHWDDGPPYGTVKPLRRLE